MRRLFALAAAFAFACAPAWAGPPAPSSTPPSANTSIIPNGGSSSVTLGNVASGSRFLAQRGYRVIDKPHAEDNKEDTAGTAFPSGQTAIYTREIPSHVVAARVTFGTRYADPMTITDFAIAPSSSLTLAGAGSSYVGAAAYDGTGAFSTALYQRGSFGHAGLASDPPGPHLALGTANPFGTSAICTTTSSASGNSTTLNLTSAAGVSAGMIAVTNYAKLLTIPPQDYVASVSSNVVTLASGMTNFAPINMPVCFLPLGITVAASANYPQYSLAHSDWVPIQSIPRLDTPVNAGGQVVGTGMPNGETVASFAAQSVTLTNPTTADIPAGTKELFCHGTTLTADLIPNYTLSFASVPAAIDSTWYVGSTSTPSQFAGTGFPSSTLVASVSGGAVTLTNPVNVGFASGTTVLFYKLKHLAADAAQGATSITFDSATGLANGEYVFGTGITGSGGAASTPTTTLSGLSGATATVAGLKYAMHAGDPLYVAYILTTNAATTVPNMAASTVGIYDGATLIGGSLPANTFAAKSSFGAITPTQAPTSTIPTGTVIQACDPLTVSAEAPPGSLTLPFKSTTYPNPLITVRYVSGGANVAYFAQPGFNGPVSRAAAEGLTGKPREFTYLCTSEGVLAPGNITSGAGGCSTSGNTAIYAIEYLLADRGVQVDVIGDSHFAGTTTADDSDNMAADAVALLPSLNLPVWYANFAYGGQTSAGFIGTAEPWLQEVPPKVLVLAGYTWNDTVSTAGYQNYEAEAMGLAQFVADKGGLPIIVTEYQRQIYGCNASDPVNEGYRKTVNAFWKAAAANSNLPIVDASSLLDDPAHTGFINPIYSGECIHSNDPGHAVVAAPLAQLMRTYLAN